MRKSNGYTSKDSTYSGCKLPRKIKGIRTVKQLRDALDEYHDDMPLCMAKHETMHAVVVNVGTDSEHLMIEEDWDY